MTFKIIGDHTPEFAQAIIDNVHDDIGRAGDSQLANKLEASDHDFWLVGQRSLPPKAKSGSPAVRFGSDVDVLCSEKAFASLKLVDPSDQFTELGDDTGYDRFSRSVKHGAYEFTVADDVTNLLAAWQLVGTTYESIFQTLHVLPKPEQHSAMGVLFKLARLEATGVYSKEAVATTLLDALAVPSTNPR